MFGLLEMPYRALTQLPQRMCTSRKYPYSPAEGIGISWGVGALLQKCVKLYWNFQRGGGGGGGLRKNPFHGGGMDIFWNYTMAIPLMRPNFCSPLVTRLAGFHCIPCVFSKYFYHLFDPNVACCKNH